MRTHLFIALGSLMAAIFAMRGYEALQDPGLGLRELYVFGGFVIAGVLIWRGVKNHNAK